MSSWPLSEPCLIQRYRLSLQPSSMSLHRYHTPSYFRAHAVSIAGVTRLTTSLTTRRPSTCTGASNGFRPDTTAARCRYSSSTSSFKPQISSSHIPSSHRYQQDQHSTMSDKLVPANPADVMVIHDITPNITTLSVPFSRFGRIEVGGRCTIGRPLHPVSFWRFNIRAQCH